MSNMLNFKYGLHSNLPSQISNGTIYVTTDEKAMYVDLGDNRIRLSSVINCTYAEWTQLKPPYSTEALYYITDKNALVKYSKDNGDDQWIQINSTADIDSLLAGLGFYFEAPKSPKHGDILVNDDGTVSIYDTNAEGVKWVSYGTVGSKLIDLSSRVAALETTVATHSTDITNLKAKDVELATDIADTRTAIGFLGKKTSLPETGTLGQSVLVDGKVYIWVAAEGETAAGWKEISSLGKRVEDLKARIEEVALAAGDKTAVETLQTNLNTLSSAVNDPGTGLAATKAIADQAAKDLADYIALHENDLTDTAITEALADAKKAGTDAQKTIDDYITAHNTLYATLAEKVKTLEDAGFVKADGTVAMSGALDLGGNKIIEVATPTDNTDAANKAYVDNQRKAVAGTNTDGSVYSEHTLKDAYAKADQAVTDLNTHIDDKNNPHEVTAEQVGLGKVENKTTEEIKAGFTGAVADGNEGFVTGDAAYDAIKDAKDALTGDADSATGSATISGANKAAALAQETATNAVNAAAAIIEGATAKTIAEVETRIGLIEQANAKLDETYATDDELDAKETSILGTVTDKETGEVSNFNGTVKGAYEAATDAASAAATAAQQGQQGIADAAAALAKANEKTTMAEVEAKGYATGTELATEKTNILGQYTDGEEKKSFTGTVGSVYDKAVANEAANAANAQAINDLSARIDRDLQAADAMIYKGTVSTVTGETGLPTADVEKGWTYKVTQNILKSAFAEAGISVNWATTTSEDPKDEYYVRAGDLLIATGDETDGKLTSITWDHVPAGYNAEYVPIMSTSVSNGVAKIELTSAHAATNEKGDLGSFQVSAESGSAVTVSVSGGNNIAIGMTWGTF